MLQDLAGRAGDQSTHTHAHTHVCTHAHTQTHTQVTQEHSIFVNITAKQKMSNQKHTSNPTIKLVVGALVVLNQNTRQASQLHRHFLIASRTLESSTMLMSDHCFFLGQSKIS